MPCRRCLVRAGPRCAFQRYAWLNPEPQERWEYVQSIGIRGSRAALLNEARTLRARFPVFEASPMLASDLGTDTATPLLLVFGSDGRVVTYARGYQRAEPLARLLTQATGARCDE